MMKRPVIMGLFGLLAGFLVVLCAASEIPEPQSLEQLRAGAKMYHDQFMQHLEASMAKLNETLHDWRDSGHPHAHLGPLAARSVDVLASLDSLVSSEAPSARRKLSQIYDETSRQMAEERLAGVTAEAEARYAEAVELLQSAAMSAVQNSTEDLVARLAEKLKVEGVVSPGKVLSEQLQTLKLADTVAESIRGLVPEFNDGDASRGLGDVLSGGLPGLAGGLGDGLGSIFSGPLFGRLRGDKDEAPAPEMAAPAPEAQTGLDVDLAYEDDKLVVSQEVYEADVDESEPVEGPNGVTITPLELGAAKGTAAPYDPLLDDTVTRADFYKERDEVFDRFDEDVELTAQVKTQRRALQSKSDSPFNVDALIQRVESSLDVLRSMRERGIAVSKETAMAIKARAAAARQKFNDMASTASKDVRQGIAPGRRLSQAESDDADDFLVFPGEPMPRSMSSSVDAQDAIIDSDSLDYERATVSGMDSTPFLEDLDEAFAFMPIMPVMMSQEIHFVFIPMDASADAEQLMESVADTIISVIAESTMSMMTGDLVYPGMDLSMFDTYDSSYELPDGVAPLGYGPVHLETTHTYREPSSATQKRRRLKSSVQSMTDLLEDSYDLEVFFYDPAWFDSASKMMMYDDEIPELSLAIRLGGPEDMGGLPPDVLMFLAESEFLMDAILANAMMPSYSVFEASANQAKAQADNENLADTIVKKLQSAYGAYGEPSKARDPYYSASELDIKWLGVMFGAVGIVLIIAIGAITAFQSRAQTSHPGYVVIDDIQAVQPHYHQGTTKVSSRKTSNLPA